MRKFIVGLVVLFGSVGVAQAQQYYPVAPQVQPYYQPQHQLQPPQVQLPPNTVMQQGQWQSLQAPVAPQQPQVVQPQHRQPDFLHHHYHFNQTQQRQCYPVYQYQPQVPVYYYQQPTYSLQWCWPFNY